MNNSLEKNKNGSIDMHVEDFDESAETCDPFQKIMQRAGDHGRFQIIYNIVFVSGLSMAGAMIYMNIILALNVPDFWCTVPGIENTNFTLDEWRQITLPRSKDNRGADKFSTCSMYDADFTEITDWDAWNATSGSNNYNVTGCQNGWSYDRTWYESTIPTHEDWVCSKDLYVTNVFVVTRIAEVLGAFVLGQMGDFLGRRFIYYISVIGCGASRIASILSTGWYIWFLVLSFIAGFTINSVFQSPLIVGMEISREQDRSSITMYQSFGWSMGTCLMPLLYWWLGKWEPFMWITSLPTVLVLVFSRYVIESPRWLINKGRYGDAICQFKKIATVNGRKFEMSEDELAEVFSKSEQEVTYGIASLFNGFRLARNTFVMAFSWSVVAISFFTLVLFSSRMGGNPFVNFLLQSIVEVPAYVVGKYLGDKYGRRFTNSVTFLISFVLCIPIIFLATDIKHELTIIILGTIIKFMNALTFFTVNLQSMEIYPTCMRQTGIALGTIVASAIGTLAPVLVYLGTTIDIRAPYYILAALFFFGGLGAAFLPETLHKKLPDTMEEAREFGKHDKFFSLPKAPPKAETTSDVTEKLNQPKYQP